MKTHFVAPSVHALMRKGSKVITPGKGNRMVIVAIDPDLAWPGLQTRLVIQRDQLYLGVPASKCSEETLCEPVTVDQALSWAKAMDAVTNVKGLMEEIDAWLDSVGRTNRAEVIKVDFAPKLSGRLP